MPLLLFQIQMYKLRLDRLMKRLKTNKANVAPAFRGTLATN